MKAKLCGKLWSLKQIVAPFKYTHAPSISPGNSVGRGKWGGEEGGVAVGGRGLCTLVELDSCALADSSGTLTLPVPVGRSATRHRPTPNQDQLFLFLPAALRGRSPPGRLETERATAAGLRAWSL